MDINKALDEWKEVANKQGEHTATQTLHQRITEMNLRELQDAKQVINITFIKHPEFSHNEWSSVREFLLQILEKIEGAVIPTLINIRNILKKAPRSST